MKVITFSSSKGGVGKSALSFNMAHRTAKKNKVLFIDLDSQCNTTSLFEPSNHTIYDVLRGEIAIQDAIKHSDSQGMDYIASSPKLRNLNPNDTKILKGLLSKLTYDYVFIDTAPALNNVTLNAITASHLVAVPILLDLFSAQGLMSVIKAVQTNNKQAEILVIPNMMVHNSKLHNNSYKELQAYIDTKENIYLSKALPNSVAMSDTLAEKKSIIQAKRIHKLSGALKELHKEMMKHG